MKRHRTRRLCLAGIAGLIALVTAQMRATGFSENDKPPASSSSIPAYATPRRPAYLASPVIRQIVWAPKESIHRAAEDSDNYPLTWGDDDALYTTWGDGTGFIPKTPDKLSCGYARITGGPEDFSGENIRSPQEQYGQGHDGRKGWGILAVGDTLYLWYGNADKHAGGAQLAWSRDHAKTWTFADWQFKDFGLVGFVNFGRAYAGARDNYVYAYSHDSAQPHVPVDRFILMRVPKDRIAERDAYEFFTGRDWADQPKWSKDIAARAAVFENPDGCLRSAMTYDAGLKRYLWWQAIPQPPGNHDRGDTRFFGGFAIYDAPEPWGPWTTAYFTDKWDVGPGEHGDFPTKWMSADGLTLYCVFSGDDQFSVRRATLVVNAPASSSITPAAPYPPSPIIKDIALDWSTHRRSAQGSDNWQLTWADDNNMYGAWGDGGGFDSLNEDGRVSLGFARVEGDWKHYRGYNVWGGKNPENPATFRGKSWGTICVGNVLYSLTVPDNPDTSSQVDGFKQTDDPKIAGPRDHYRYVHLIKSTDHGAHWTKAPWRWWREDDVMIPTFLNFGRNNAGARDDFVYVYFIRPQSTAVTQAKFNLNIHRPGALFLARVHRDQIFSGRDAYEWYVGMSGGFPLWGPLSAKQPVFEDPNGTGWCVSAIYNPGLKRYLLALEHDVTHEGSLGLFDAPEPWGPWTTVHYWSKADPLGKVRPGSTLAWRDNLFFFSFAPKWWSPDGRDFTMVFTGAGSYKDNDSFNTIRGHFVLHDPP